VQTLRLFIAIRCPEAVAAALSAWQAELRAAGGQAVRWVAPAAFHLTLRFFGELPEEAARAAEAALRAAVAGRSPFPVTLRGGGAFPRPTAARVIWAGVANPGDGLADLAAAVEAACAAQGLGRAEGPFSPHLTVGRARRAARPPDMGAALRTAAARAFGTWPVETVELIHSTLTPSGPVYRTRLTTPLAKR
jgi:2'-5' RNA ligase